MSLLVFFIVLNVINVILQTVKTLVTTKSGPIVASIGNAIAYGVYTVLLVYMTCDLSLWAKVFIVGGCNLVGVYIVKILEKKMQKDRLWKIEVTVPYTYSAEVNNKLNEVDLSHNYIDLGEKYTIFNIYCSTQSESKKAKKIVKEYSAKYFASEAKIL